MDYSTLSSILGAIASWVGVWYIGFDKKPGLSMEFNTNEIKADKTKHIELQILNLGRREQKISLSL